jgi:hypothetical protein
MNGSLQEQPNALVGCLEVCRRCEVLVDTVTADSEATGVYRLLGPHLRHCLDHFVNLLSGIAVGHVDYDARDRDPQIERQPEAFRAALAQTVERLRTIGADDLARPMRVLQQAATGIPPQPVDSTLERELVFLSSHTIHHLALMAHLARSHGTQVPEELGVAFSTAAYRASLERSSH